MSQPEEPQKVSFVSTAAKQASEKDVSATQRPKKKSWAQMKKERAQLDQEMMREIAEMGALPKGWRAARRWLQRTIVYGAAVIIAVVLYGLVTILWPSSDDEESTVRTHVGDERMDEDIDKMLESRRRLMRGKSQAQGDAALKDESSEDELAEDP